LRATKPAGPYEVKRNDAKEKILKCRHRLENVDAGNGPPPFPTDKSPVPNSLVHSYASGGTVIQIQTGWNGGEFLVVMMDYNSVGRVTALFS